VDQNYVARGEERMDLYRRMAAIRSQNDADDLLDEIIDRYGEPPKGVLNLIEIALLRANAQKAGIKDIRQKAADVLFSLSKFDFQAVSAICSDDAYKGRIQLLANCKEPTLRLRLANGVDILRQCKVFIQSYNKCLTDK
jgi:transcription-repair coupling factor (superfamily II helicase)